MDAAIALRWHKTFSFARKKVGYVMYGYVLLRYFGLVGQVGTIGNSTSRDGGAIVIRGKEGRKDNMKKFFSRFIQIFFVIYYYFTFEWREDNAIYDVSDSRGKMPYRTSVFITFIRFFREKFYRKAFEVGDSQVCKTTIQCFPFFAAFFILNTLIFAGQLFRVFKLFQQL